MTDYGKRIIEGPRSKIIGLIFSLIMLLAPIIVILSAIRAYEIGRDAAVWVNVIAFCVLVLSYIFRHRLSEKVKVRIIVLLSVAGAVISIFNFGFMGVGILYGILALIFVATFFSKKKLKYLSYTLTIILLLITLLYVSGILCIDIGNIELYIHSWYAWLLVDAVTLYIGFIMVMIITSNKAVMRSVLNHLERKNQRLASSVREAGDIANTDWLTGLHNRRSIVQLLDKEIGAYQDETFLGVMCLDIHNFSVVNERYGFAIGDKLIQQFSDRLHRASGKYSCARMNGDEFLLIIPGLKAASLLRTFFETLREALEVPYSIDEYRIQIYLNAGAALYPRDGDNSIQLINAAKLAVDHVKQKPVEMYCLYGSSLEVTLKRRAYIEQNLVIALKDHQFSLFYQPIVKASNSIISGQEVLIRWDSPKIGRVKNIEYLTVAEESGQITEIDFWVIEHVFKKIEQDSRVGEWAAGKTVNINISAQTLRLSDFMIRFQSLVKRYHVQESSLVFEITEHILASGTEIITHLVQLRKLGCKVSLDDFGTGFSSLSVLSEMPIDQVKLDKTFIKNVFSNKKREMLMMSILEMLNKLDLSVVVEGVENQRQFDYLTELAFDVLVQGYYFSKPVHQPIWNVTV